jgi:hypothetical protein
MEAAGWCLVGKLVLTSSLVLLSIFSPFIPFGPSNLVYILNPTPFEPRLLVSSYLWESQQRMVSLHIDPCPPMRASRVFSVRRTPQGETQTRSTSLYITPLVLLMLLRVRQGTSQQ